MLGISSCRSGAFYIQRKNKRRRREKNKTILMLLSTAVCPELTTWALNIMQLKSFESKQGSRARRNVVVFYKKAKENRMDSLAEVQNYGFRKQKRGVKFKNRWGRAVDLRTGKRGVGRIPVLAAKQRMLSYLLPQLGDYTTFTYVWWVSDHSCSTTTVT